MRGTTPPGVRLGRSRTLVSGSFPGNYAFSAPGRLFPTTKPSPFDVTSTLRQKNRNWHHLRRRSRSNPLRVTTTVRYRNMFDGFRPRSVPGPRTRKPSCSLPVFIIVGNNPFPFADLYFPIRAQFPQNWTSRLERRSSRSSFKIDNSRSATNSIKRNVVPTIDHLPEKQKKNRRERIIDIPVA